MDVGARIIRKTTPRFAKMVSHKFAHGAATQVLEDLEQNHGRPCLKATLQDLATPVGTVVQTKEESRTDVGCLYVAPNAPGQVFGRTGLRRVKEARSVRRHLTNSLCRAPPGSFARNHLQQLENPVPERVLCRAERRRTCRVDAVCLRPDLGEGKSRHRQTKQKGETDA